MEQYARPHCTDIRFRCILGKLLADGGGATRIAEHVDSKFGQNMYNGQMLVAAFIVGLHCSLK